MISVEMEKSNGFKILGGGNPTGLTCGLKVENDRLKKKARISPRCLDLASGGK